VNRFLHRLATLVAGVALVAGIAATPGEAVAGGDNAAVAINTKNGSSLFRFAFKVRRVAGGIVDSSNAAVAFSQCESCRTTAIAIQIVLATGNPTTVTPTNVAVALNDQCTLCVTFASAYQFVLGTGGPVRFTAEGNQELAAIKRELRALRRAHLEPPELQERVSSLMTRLRTVLGTQLVPAGSDDEAAEDVESEEGEDALEEDDVPTTAGAAEQEGGETSTTTPRTTTTGTTTTGTATTPSETTGSTTAPDETSSTPTETTP
jgi:putative peptide zinc metalloprotease protein